MPLELPQLPPAVLDKLADDVAARVVEKLRRSDAAAEPLALTYDQAGRRLVFERSLAGGDVQGAAYAQSELRRLGFDVKWRPGDAPKRGKGAGHAA